MAPGPADVGDRDSWSGGHYGLSVLLGPRDDERLLTAGRLLWAAAGLRSRSDRVEALADHDHGGTVLGVVRLPRRVRVVAALAAVRDEDGQDWLDLGLPLGALAAADRRVGGYPFEPEDGLPSAPWREPLDDWFVAVAEAVWAEVPFVHGTVGFEVSGQPAGRDRTERWVTTLLPRDGHLVRLAPTR